MNAFKALLALVVVGVVAPVQGRSALSQMLDMVGEFQNTDFGTGNIPEYSESRTNKAIANMQRLFQTTREAAELAATQDALPIDPNAIKQIDLMERIIPLSIRIVADLASKTAADPMLEPALDDLTNTVNAATP